ncbi:MAG: FkbM family methyltransferase [Humidesulfovibrio sp.]|nr:FkbM family methyltransferase [Humidesulfovibrio sp.]
MRTILDVGANNGDYAAHLLRMFPLARLHAFEPLPDAYGELAAKAARDERITPYNVALSDVKGQVEFHRSSYGPSSSLLGMGLIHKELAPKTAGDQVIMVESRSLDDMVAGRDLEAEIFLKLDVQGYEDQVLRGGKAVLARTALVQVEVSFCELYNGQAGFDAVHGLLREGGLEFRGFKSQLCSPDDGTPLQAHAFYIRPGLAHPLRPVPTCPGPRT